MRFTIILLLTIMIMIFAGCSGSYRSITDPAMLSNLADKPDSQVIILDSGTINLDTQTIEFCDRENTAYLDVTRFLGSNFQFTIKGIVPPDILDIELYIANASMMTVFDVLIVFENLYGKKVMNPDSYIDIFQAWDLDPFIAFRKEDPTRGFPMAADTEQLLLKYPSGSNPMVSYFVIAHLGSNTGGVYELSNWGVNGNLTPSGGTVNVSVAAMDHQQNVSTVIADTSPITGGLTYFSVTPNPDIWQAEISNTMLAPEGVYVIPVMASSPASPQYNTYNFFEIEVSETTNTSFGTDMFLFDPGGESSYPSVTGRHNMICDGDKFYFTFTNHYSGPMGQNNGNIFLTKSTDGGETWSTPAKITNESAYDDILYLSSLAKGSNGLYLCYQRVHAFTDLSFEILKSVNDGDTWSTLYTSTTQKGFPSICADPDSPSEKLYVAYVNTESNKNNIYVASSVTPGEWNFTRVNDTECPVTSLNDPDICFNPVTDSIMVNWSDGYVTSGNGSRIRFDKSSNGTSWGADVLVNSLWSTGQSERNPIISVNPSNGKPGILFNSMISPDNMVIYFSKSSDQGGSSFINPVNLSGTCFEAFSSSLDCTSSGRWVAAWYGTREIYLTYDAMFMESLDDGTSWINDQVVNDVMSTNCLDPKLASNGSDVCVGWSDAHDFNETVWIDHGVH
jgi:hypothetical protein